MFNIRTDNPSVLAHLYGTSALPSTAAGTGAGTGPTLANTGTDIAGSISVTTGTAPSVSAVVVTVTFITPFASAPNIIIAPANAITAALGTANVFVTSTTTTFVINSNTVALAATTLYKWFYVVIG